jgi:hypothetical protein
LCKHENRERYKRIELEDLESKVKRRKMATMDKEGLTIKARPLLSLGPASCEPGLLGIFLWYRPGLFQCRFDITFIGKSPIFLRPDLLPSQAGSTTASHQPWCEPVRAAPKISAIIFKPAPTPDPPSDATAQRRGHRNGHDRAARLRNRCTSPRGVGMRHVHRPLR